jgi:uncharacterized protein YbjT (DUF2867 family)
MTVLVSGGTGRLGRLVVQGLLARGAAVRVLTRDPQAAAALLGAAGPRLQFSAGDLAQPGSLRGVADGARAVLLLSPIHPRLAAQQIALVDEARRAGVDRIVKVSGSAWTLDPPGRSASGDAHRQVEQHLAVSGIAHALLRPNAWMQVALAGVLQALRAGQPLTDRHGGAAVGYIDVRDLADVTVDQLLATTLAAAPLELTGPQPLRVADVAAEAAALLGRQVLVQAADAPAAATAAVPEGTDPQAFVQRVHGEFGRLIRSGAAAGVTDTVPRMLQRPARSVARWLRDELLPSGR